MPTAQLGGQVESGKLPHLRCSYSELRTNGLSREGVNSTVYPTRRMSKAERRNEDLSHLPIPS